MKVVNYFSAYQKGGMVFFIETDDDQKALDIARDKVQKDLGYTLHCGAECVDCYRSYEIEDMTNLNIFEAILDLRKGKNDKETLIASKYEVDGIRVVAIELK